ncbi:MAG: hypothetical protein Q8O00_04420 [Holophaga sp.]|nr:hypothetical protein [Holophaga sp.]
METDFKSNLLIWTLGAAVLCVGGFGLYTASQRREAQALREKAENLKTLQDSASQPSESRTGFRIETLTTTFANSAGNEARAIGAPGLQFEWSIVGGKLESGNQNETALWSAGPSGEVVITCRAFDATGAETSTRAIIPIQPLPTIARFEVVPSVVTQGTSARLGWNVQECRKLVLNPGNIDVTAVTGPGFEVKPTETATYTITATGNLGTFSTREVTLKVVAPPEIIVLRAEPKSGSPGAFTVIGEFEGGKAQLKAEGTVLASGDTSPLQADLSGLKAGSSVNLVVTNEAGTSITRTLQFSIKPQ